MAKHSPILTAFFGLVATALALVAALVATIFCVRLLIQHRANESDVLVETNLIAPASPTPTVTSASASPATTTTLPATVNLAVPFTVQAPNGNWDSVHEESCEEASLLMVSHFLKQTAFGSPDAVDAEMNAMIDFETNHGYAVDVTVDQLNAIARDYLGLQKGRVVSPASVASIKKELAAGRPVIIPAAGRELGNPHFTSPGPLYHMLVIVGYDADGFITNDPGTKFGEGYHYSFDTLLAAIHDWNGQNDITQGRSAYLVFD